MKRFVIPVLLFASIAVFAQQAEPAWKPATQAPPLSKHDKIKQLIMMTGSPQMALDLMKQQMAVIKKSLPLPPKAQDDFADQFVAAVKLDEFVDLLIPVYSRHLSEEEVDGLLAFNRTPLGQKILKTLPVIMAECGDAGQKWGSELGLRIGRDIIERVKRGDYGPWDLNAQRPPAPDQSK